jgi:hypothetical protein
MNATTPAMTVTSKGPRQLRRRVIALTLMMALGVSAIEASAGPVTDGSVHHENEAEASSHWSPPTAGHDHGATVGSITTAESGTPVHAQLAPTSGRSEHEHPGVDDHRAHVHGVALIPTVSMMFSAIVMETLVTTSDHHDDPTVTSLPRPPRS